MYMFCLFGKLERALYALCLDHLSRWRRSEPRSLVRRDTGMKLESVWPATPSCFLAIPPHRSWTRRRAWNWWGFRLNTVPIAYQERRRYSDELTRTEEKFISYDSSQSLSFNGGGAAWRQPPQARIAQLRRTVRLIPTTPSFSGSFLLSLALWKSQPDKGLARRCFNPTSRSLEVDQMTFPTS